MFETPTRATLEAERAERAHTDAAFRSELDDTALDLVAGGQTGQTSSYCEMDLCRIV